MVSAFAPISNGSMKGSKRPASCIFAICSGIGGIIGFRGLFLILERLFGTAMRISTCCAGGEKSQRGW